MQGQKKGNITLRQHFMGRHIKRERDVIFGHYGRKNLGVGDFLILLSSSCLFPLGFRLMWWLSCVDPQGANGLNLQELREAS